MQTENLQRPVGSGLLASFSWPMPPSLGDEILRLATPLDFGRPGFLLRARGWSDREWRLEGRRYVVTGGNQGIGFALADRLARAGARVCLIGRDATRLREASARLTNEYGAAAVETECADLSSVSELKSLGDGLNRDAAPIDGLVLNAGALFNQRTMTDEGHERSFTLNAFGPWVLGNLLAPRLEREHGRLLLMSSGGMYLAGLDEFAADPQYSKRRYDGALAYAEAKRFQVANTALWSRLFPGLFCASLHPGWVDTSALRESLPLFRALTLPLLRSPAQGADTAFWLLARQERDDSGSFYFDREVQTFHRLRRTRFQARSLVQLWDLCAELSGLRPERWPGSSDLAAVAAAP